MGEEKWYEKLLRRTRGAIGNLMPRWLAYEGYLRVWGHASYFEPPGQGCAVSMMDAGERWFKPKPKRSE